MRIIAGKFKGKKLKEFELQTTRPTSDLLRESLFNIIGEKVVNSVFLDLFAGTGAVGLEAISRGAKTCYFVDSNRESIKIVKSNLSLININENSLINNNDNTNVKVMFLDYNQALNSFKNGIESFDIIFLDPPYASDYAENSIKFILNNNLLKPNGYIVWEHDKFKISATEKFNIVKQKKYGDKYLSCIKMQSNE